jgi:hypothetical protein
MDLDLTTDIHAHGGVRTLNPSKREATDPHLRPSDYRSSALFLFVALNISTVV